MSMTYIRTRVTVYQIARAALELAAVGFGMGFVVRFLIVAVTYV
jgi:hypothetical protein